MCQKKNVFVLEIMFFVIPNVIPSVILAGPDLGNFPGGTDSFFAAPQFKND